MTTASGVWNYIQRRIQPLHRHVHFDFQYRGTEDVDRLSAEPIDREVRLRVIRKIFLDQLTVPYMPTVFQASNPLVGVRFLSFLTAFYMFDFSSWVTLYSCICLP